MFFLLRIVKRLTSLGIVLVAVAAVMTAATLIIIPQAATIVTANEGTAGDLELNVLAQRSEMFAADGSSLTLLTEVENREPVTLDEVPQEVIDSILAIEDADFYEHDGVNLRATFRALVENVNAGGIAQGGSTITQQLVKNSILTPDQNLSRKTTEAFYAVRLERQMTKDEILERYLNTVYFGAGAYGVQAAAETYWGFTDVGDLGWEEAALLAGIIRNPTGFDPTLNPDRARARRGVVLDRLVATEHLTEDEAADLKFRPLPAERQEPKDRAPTDYFIQEALENILNDETILDVDPSVRYAAVYRGGLKIYTTFDPAAQAAALEARELVPDIKANCFRDQRRDNDPEGECVPNFTVAIATLDSHTGAVRALVGGPEFQREKFNIATQGKRQPGSTMKTYILATLFEQGFTPSDNVRTDRPCSFPNPGGSPDPYVVDSRFGGGGGIGTLAAATRASNNCSFVRLGRVATNESIFEMASRLGIDTSEFDDVPSAPLGTEEITPMEMAGAYSVFANDGVYNEPWYIERVEDRDGNIIYEHRPDASRSVSTETARMITETLQGNVERGTGRRARIDGHFAAGKTGTTQDFTDAWFVGYTDYYTTAVWLGDPDQKTRIKFPEWGARGWSGSGRGGFGGELPSEVWGAFMTAIHADLEPVEFNAPEPYRGGRFLAAPDEINPCSLSGDFSTRNTVLRDSDGDGKDDCFVALTTTTEEPPETQPPQPEPDPGDDSEPEGPTEPPPTVPAPPPTVPPTTGSPVTNAPPTETTAGR